MVVARILAIILVIAISVFIFMIRGQVENLAVYGYPGILVLSFLSYATVLLPAPGIALVFSFAGVLNPIIVGLVAGLGATLGETVGYMAGFSSQAVIEGRPHYDRIVSWMKKNSPLTILLLAAFPNPLFDLVGIVAGAFRVPIWRFFLFCWIGESIKMMFFSLLGAYSFDFLGRFL